MSKTSSAAKRKYNTKAYDRIEISLRKGQKDYIKQIATEHDLSVNELIVTSLCEYLLNTYNIDLSTFQPTVVNDKTVE